MSKTKYTAEFEIHASPKMLYPYLSTAAGLSEWIADDVNINQDKVFTFVWDGFSYPAKKTAQKANQYIKFEFLPDKTSVDKTPSFLEFKLDINEMTQTSFLKVTDFSDLEDSKELWDNVVGKLRTIVGG
jgi:uncharacterized protein YndB with AHSA1/START domain